MTKIKCGTREERTDWKDLWQEDLKGPKMGFKCVEESLRVMEGRLHGKRQY